MFETFEQEDDQVEVGKQNKKLEHFLSNLICPIEILDKSISLFSKRVISLNKLVLNQNIFKAHLTVVQIVSRKVNTWLWVLESIVVRI